MADPDETVDPDPAETEGFRPLIAEMRLLVQELSTLVRSELAWQASRARVVVAGARTIGLAVLFALIFVIFALGGLVIGLLLALTPLVTAWGATAIVVGALVAAAALCLGIGLGSWRRMKRLLSGDAKR